ncbi:COP9 signalosome subunit 6 [Backusella circina FSU 941]|nr:COP9 signalosome subunit 6 [Backusella circina FSU 941]
MSAMDTSEDSPGTSVPGVIVSDVQSSSGLSISVHPLVLLNISDHYTRIKLQAPSVIENGRVYGALLASQSGRDIDIINSFELESNNAVDLAFLHSKLEQLKQVFPQLDFMGWYSLGSKPTEAELKIHEQFLQVNESCLFLQMDPSGLTGGAREFPVTIYESIIDVVEGNMRVVFIKASYKVETEEAERIAVDHVAKPSSSSADSGVGSSLIAHLTTQRNAIAMLNQRIKFLHQYLLDVKQGNIPIDHDVVRQIASLCRRSPVIEKETFDEQFSTEYSDVLLVAYLATITKGLNSVNDLVDKFNLVNGSNNSGSTKQVPMSKKERRMQFMRK